ncbi:hypothetical protein DUNSADRAFT_16093, partial [Dunaliella salina]
MQAAHVEESRLEGFREKKSQAKRLLLELRLMEAWYKQLESLLKGQNQQLADALQQQPFHLARQPPQLAQATQSHGQPPHEHHQAPAASLQLQVVHDPHLSGLPSEPSLAVPFSPSQPAVAAAAAASVPAARRQTTAPARPLSCGDCSLLQAPSAARPGADCVEPGLLEQGVEKEQQSPRKQARAHWTQPEQEMQQLQARQQQGASLTEESPGIPMPPLPMPACPLLPSQQPSQRPLQQHAGQHEEQATKQREKAPTAQPSTSAAGTSRALPLPTAAAAAAAAAEAATSELLAPGSHVTLLPPQPSEAQPSLHTPILPPPPPPHSIFATAAPTPVH